MEQQDQRWLDEFFKTIFTEAGIGIVIKGVDGRMLDCNPAFQSMLGYSNEEIRQRDYLEITYPLDKAYTRLLFGELVSGQRKNYIMEKRYLAKDGQVVWGRMTASAVYNPDGRVQFVIGMVENITASKQIETELGELRRRLMQGRENERLRLAQELHDGPLQEIMAVTFQLQPLENSLNQEADRSQLEAVQESLRQLTRSLRTLCGEMRPPTLIPFGLEKAIRSHAGEFGAAHPEIDISLDLAHDGQTLSEQVRIVLFRIYQEALNNIVRHAQATQVWVQLALEEEQTVLEVRDNGVGFELPGRWIRLARQGHLGLVGALERAGEVGGALEITSALGQGTKLRVVVPLADESLLVQAGGKEGR
jgi:PAS domain S-box-containing protein